MHHLVFLLVSFAFAQPRPGTPLPATPVRIPAAVPKTAFLAPEAGFAAGLNANALRSIQASWRLVQGLPEASGIRPWELFEPLLADLDGIWISIDPSRKQPQPLVMLTGRFANPIWAQLLKAGPGLAAANAILIGEPTAVAAARRRLRLRSGPSHPLAAYVRDLSARGDVWIAGAPGVVSPAAFGPGAADFAREVKTFGLVMTARDRVDLALTLEATSDGAAERLMGLYEAGMAQLSDEELRRIAGGLSAERQGASLRFQLSVAQDEVAAIAGKRAGARPPLARQAEMPRERRSVRIVGMEEGTREIPYSAPK